MPASSASVEGFGFVCVGSAAREWGQILCLGRYVKPVGPLQGGYSLLKSVARYSNPCQSPFRGGFWQGLLAFPSFIVQNFRNLFWKIIFSFRINDLRLISRLTFKSVLTDIGLAFLRFLLFKFKRFYISLIIFLSIYKKDLINQPLK